MRTATAWLAGFASACLLLGGLRAADGEGGLPRFTEVREAAALFFVKKHVPELLPLLEELKKNNLAQYQHEVRAIFQVTEMLADLEDEPRRHDLELKIWKTETRAHTLVAQLSTPDAAARKKVEAQLQECARELVELDVQVLELKAEQLDKELGEIKDELSRIREQMDREVKARYERLLNKVKRTPK
jgi:hypothetical protein